ncbi:hypothetical protein Q3G72_003014 [Acer saccharum]|nr:hypothetical protein Q3G72_003014 [Acer saccharum]
MADVNLEVATAAQPTKRTFKKLSFRGVDLDALLDSLLMSLSSSSLHVLAEDSQLEIVDELRRDDSSLELSFIGLVPISWCRPF